MRTLLTGEKALAIGGETDVYVRLLVENGSGTPIDVGAALGTHWVINASWGETLDTPVSSATFTLVQQIGANSLGPLISASVLNVLDNGVTYAPLLDIGRHVWAYTATVPRGTAFDPSTTTLWRPMFDGRIDDVSSADAQEMLGPITLTCSDLGAWLMDTQIETEGVQYGTTPVGTPLETVMQNILTACTPVGEPAVTLVKASGSSYAVTDWKQGETKIMEALQTLVLDTTGEDVRYRFDASHVSQLTWTDPDRGRVSVDATIGTDKAVISTLALSIANVRNAIEMSYADPDSGESGTVTSEDASSIAKYRRRFNRIGSSVMIGSSAEATVVTAAVASDLSDAPAQFSAACHYLWFAQLYDRYTFTANNRQFDEDQTLGVVGYQHTIENGRAATTLTLAGRVVGAYAAWLRRLVTTSVKINVLSSIDILRINSKESADGLTRDFTVLVGTRVESLHVHYRTVAITETEDWYDFSETAVLPVGGGSPLILRPTNRVVTFSLPQPTRGYAMALRLVPYAAGNRQGDSVLVTVDAAPPGINATIHATKIGNLARMEIDITFGPSDGPVSVAVIERVLGVPTTLLTLPMTAPGTIDWTTNIELDARPIPANADSISWTVQITDVDGDVWTFGPTYALASAVLINAVPTESAGVATITVTVTDAGAYLLKTYNDAGIVSQMSWHVVRLGVKTVKASTTVPGGGATSGTYTLVETLDPLHPIQIAGFVHYVDGDTECFGVWTFDSDKIATVINATVANEALVARITLAWDTDTLRGANCARYSVDGGAWVETVTVSSAYLSQFTVAQTSARQAIAVQAKNAVDAGATWGNICTLEVDALYVELPGPSLVVTPTPGASSYSIEWSGSAGTTVSIDGGTYGTPAASPIVVTRTAYDITYSFKCTLNGQTVTNEVTIPSLEKDTVTPALVVVPSTPATTTLSFTVTATNPAGGTAPTIIVTLIDCTAVGYTSGDPVTSGATVVVNRPAFDTGVQATVTFTATISGGGSAVISRTIQNQVKASFGPTLTITPTPGTSSYSIAWSGSAGTTVSIDGGGYGTPAASPIVVTRHATNDINYSFKASLDGQEVTNSITVPSLEKDTVTPNLTVTPGTATATELSFTVTCSNPGGGAAPTIIIKLIGCTATGYSDGDPVTSGATVVVQRPAFGTTAQATVKFVASISGGGSEEIGRTIQNQVRTSFGPTLDVRAQPGPTSYAIIWSGSVGITVAIDNGAYGTPAASPITVTRTAADIVYTFKGTLDGQDVTNAVTIPGLEKDTVTPNLTVVPSAPATTTLSFTVTASNPAGGTAPTIILTFVGCTVSGYTSGDPVTSGATVVAARPAFDTTAQATVTFTASISGGGSEAISRTVQNQVKTVFGPSLVLTPTENATTVDIAYTATGTLTYDPNTGSYSTPPASPITGIARNAAGGATKRYTFKCSADGQEIADTVLVRAQDATGGAAAAITNISAYNSFYPNDGGGSFDVSWSCSITAALIDHFDVTWHISAGNYQSTPIDGTETPMTSGGTINKALASAPSGSLAVKAIDSYGAVMASGTMNDTIFG